MGKTHSQTIIVTRMGWGWGRRPTGGLLGYSRKERLRPGGSLNFLE
jgi:hypothetical protein